MEREERYDALIYSVNTYTNRNISYNLAQLFPSDSKSKSRKTKNPSMTFTFVDPRIDAFIAREAIKDFKEGKNITKGSYIPPYHKKGDVK